MLTLTMNKKIFKIFNVHQSFNQCEQAPMVLLEILSNHITKVIIWQINPESQLYKFK